MAEEQRRAPTGGIGDSLRRAEAAVAKLAETYVEWAMKDVMSLRAALAAARADPDRIADHLSALHAVAHNVKGQGGSFGFPLVTRIGHSLTRLVRGRELASSEVLDIIAAHIDAIAMLLEHRVTGDGGELGEAMALRLEELANARADDRASA